MARIVDMTVSWAAVFSRSKLCEGETSKTKDATEIKLEADNASLKAQVVILKTAIGEITKLHEACIDTGMSYADRVAHREQDLGSSVVPGTACVVPS